jgi:serpin B
MNASQRIPSWLVLTQLAATLGLACSSSGGGGSGGGTEVRSDKVRITSPVLQTGDLATLATDDDHFAWDLYQAVRAGSADNLVFSPFSVSIALAMTYGGAKATTADQMAATLHFSLPAARLHPTFDALDLALEAPPAAGADTGTFQLSLANALWGQQGFTFVPDFLDLLATNYGAAMHTVDFGAPESARLTINQWVSDQTHAKIPNLLPPMSLDGGTVFVLTNAVYFNADWNDPFDANSKDGTFNAPTGPVQVPMMAKAFGTVSAWTGTGYRAATLPYKGGKTSMIVIVPDAGTFDAFEAGLTFDAFDAILRSSPTTGVFLSMPRFKIDASVPLNQVLVGLGMADAFNPGAADFSGIDGGKDIYLTAVIHHALIAVDEKGTTAAAATAVVGGVTDGPGGEPLVVDRPFIYAIRDDATGTILFLGRVLDPSK